MKFRNEILYIINKTFIIRTVPVPFFLSIIKIIINQFPMEKYFSETYDNLHHFKYTLATR